jgi:gliding motility-associated lipoprotein GldH
MKTPKHLVSIFIFLLFAVTLSSCSKGPVFEKYLKMKNFTWDRFDIKHFEIPIEEGGKNYDITAVVRCTDQFQYEDLPFYVILTTPSGEERMREVTIPVRNNGKMIGQPNANLYEDRLILWKGINLADKGTCKITFENMIPKIQTEGIDQIGIVVTRAK